MEESAIVRNAADMHRAVRCAQLNSPHRQSSPDSSKKQLVDLLVRNEEAVSCSLTLNPIHIILLFRTLIRNLNERVNLLWNLKDKLEASGLSVKGVHASALWDTIMFVDATLIKILTSQIIVNDSMDRNKVCAVQYLQKVSADIVPRLFQRVRSCLQMHVHESTSQYLKQYSALNLNPFLVLNQRRSGILNRMLGLVSICTAHNIGGPNSKCAQSELEIASYLVDQVVVPIYKCFLYTRKVNETEPLIRQNSQRSEELAKRMTALAFNAMMTALLDHIITEEVAFDEFGVYKLYRILLRLQEAVGVAKKELELQPPCQLMDDITAWNKAEAIVQELNKAVFTTAKLEYKKLLQDKSKEINTHNAADQELLEDDLLIGSNSSRSALVLNSIERDKLKRQVTPIRRSLFPSQASARRKGTVFVTLELDKSCL